MTRAPYLLRLIEILYSCAEGDTPWREFLTSLREAARASVTSLTVHQLNGRGYGVDSYVGSDPREFQRYMQHYGRLNPWFSGASRFPEGVILSTENILPTAAFRKTVFYNDWGKKNHVTHALGGAVTIRGSAMCFLAVNRGDLQPSFQDKERQLLQSLMPHLRRAIDLRDRLALIDEREWVLETLAFPLIHVAADGSVLWANAAAERMFRKGRALFVREGKLYAEFPHQDAQLKAMLGGKPRTLEPVGGARGGWLRINRGDDDSELSLFIARAPAVMRRTVGSTSSPQAFFVFVAAQAVTSEILIRRLCEAWELTAAECALAMTLLETDSLQAASDRLRITRNTAKSQLASVFQKAGVRRQSELMRRLLALAVMGDPERND